MLVSGTFSTSDPLPPKPPTTSIDHKKGITGITMECEKHRSPYVERSEPCQGAESRRKRIPNELMPSDEAISKRRIPTIVKHFVSSVETRSLDCKNGGGHPSLAQARSAACREYGASRQILPCNRPLLPIILRRRHLQF